MENGNRSSAFEFHGGWREFAPIALTNLLLTIVTLGVYRFWATTRARQYFWGQTRFIDERLEWTGTGAELFVGFIMVLFLIGAPLLFLQFGVQALIFQGYAKVAGIFGVAAFLAIFYMTGVARFRALRYRLSRTYWHGIRGGSDNQGFGYGLAYIWKSLLGYVAAGLLIPWAMMSLWNKRWNAMSFGPFAFRSAGESSQTMKRFLLFYLAPFIFAIGIGIVTVAMMPAMGHMQPGTPPPFAAVAGFVAFAFGFYFLLGLIALAFYAKFFRVAVGGLALGDLDFSFSASTKEWLKLFLGDVALVIMTLGVGYIFLSYRHWKFFITHLEATGEIDFNALTQSATRAPTQGEGLLDAFDVGAF